MSVFLPRTFFALCLTCKLRSLLLVGWQGPSSTMVIPLQKFATEAAAVNSLVINDGEHRRWLCILYGCKFLSSLLIPLDPFPLFPSSPLSIPSLRSQARGFVVGEWHRSGSSSGKHMGRSRRLGWDRGERGKRYLSSPGKMSGRPLNKFFAGNGMYGEFWMVFVSLPSPDKCLIFHLKWWYTGLWKMQAGEQF